MSVMVYHEPEEVWGLYLENLDSGGTFFEELATNTQYGIEIHASVNRFNELEIEVMADGKEVYSEFIIGEKDCVRTVNKAYNTYLYESFVNNYINEENNEQESSEEEENQLLIDDREEELDLYVSDFCSGVLGFNSLYEFEEEDLEDIKEHFLEYLYRKHNVPIYRPMYLEDENGEEFFEEYPYECMEFEDEKNPVYEKKTS